MMVRNAKRNSRGGLLASRILLVIGLAIGANVILTALAGIFIGRFHEITGNAYIEERTADAQRPHRKQQTLPPRDSAVDSAGFIHIGKTGGSTITTLIRNGCHSFDKGPCKNVTNESAISKLVEHYYHVPDFWRLPTANHKIFIVSVRDVFDRTVSALLYEHPDNAKAYNLKKTARQAHYGPLAYGCFPTLEIFAGLMNGNSTECNYPYRFNEIRNSDCAGLACAAIHGKVRFFSHLFFNYRNILDSKIPTDPPRQIYVVRQEHFWDDWRSVNEMLGQTEPVAIPKDGAIQRNVSGVKAPVTRDISDEGRRKLCKALETEYTAYFKLLNRAANLKIDDVNQCIQKSRKNCPTLDIDAMARHL